MIRWGKFMVVLKVNAVSVTIKNMKENNNKKIIDLIKDRLEVGQKEYGHGIDVNVGRDWHQEALEEILDACVYIGAKLIQIKNNNDIITYNDPGDENAPK